MTRCVAPTHLYSLHSIEVTSPLVHIIVCMSYARGSYRLCMMPPVCQIQQSNDCFFFLSTFPTLDADLGNNIASQRRFPVFRVVVVGGSEEASWSWHFSFAHLRTLH